MMHELLAQIHDNASLLASDHRVKKPTQFPRPDHVRGAAGLSPREPEVREDAHRAVGAPKQSYTAAMGRLLASKPVGAPR